jgi:plastocyanin
MNKLLKLIIAMVVVGGVAAAIVMLTGKEPAENKKPAESKSEVVESSQADTVPATVSITYDSSGFTPAEVSVKSGDNITVVNKSEEEAEPSSDPHPAHTINPEINFGDIEPGGSKTVTVTTTGTWGYHNHYKAEHRGTITVQ